MDRSEFVGRCVLKRTTFGNPHDTSARRLTGDVEQADFAERDRHAGCAERVTGALW